MLNRPLDDLKPGVFDSWAEQPAHYNSLLRFDEGRMGTKPEPGKSAWQPITPGLRDWRSQMDARDVERFEAAGGELLEDLGYPRAVVNPCSASVETASRMRKRWPETLVLLRTVKKSAGMFNPKGPGVRNAY